MTNRRKRIFWLFILFLWGVSSSCAGSSSSNSALVNGPGRVLFASDFENEDRQCWRARPNGGGWNIPGCGGFVEIGIGENVELVTGEIAHSGRSALKLTYRQNEDFAGAEVDLGGENRVFTRFYDFYSNDFDFAFGMKMHRLRSIDREKGINNYDIVAHAIGQPRSFSTHNFSGRNDMAYINIVSNDPNTDWRSGDEGFSFRRGQWYCVETEILLNDPGERNGAARIWVDGNLIVEADGVAVRGDMSRPINRVLFGGWYSNGAAGKNPEINPSTPTVRFIDDIAISTGRIGCS